MASKLTGASYAVGILASPSSSIASRLLSLNDSKLVDDLLTSLDKGESVIESEYVKTLLNEYHTEVRNVSIFRYILARTYLRFYRLRNIRMITRSQMIHQQQQRQVGKDLIIMK